MIFYKDRSMINSRKINDVAEVNDSEPSSEWTEMTQFSNRFYGVIALKLRV